MSREKTKYALFLPHMPDFQIFLCSFRVSGNEMQVYASDS
jgi:hypothetical protein